MYSDSKNDGENEIRSLRSSAELSSFSRKNLMITLRKYARKFAAFAISYPREHTSSFVKICIVIFFLASLITLVGVSIKMGYAAVIMGKLGSIGYYGLIIIFIGFIPGNSPIPWIYTILALTSGFLYGLPIALATCVAGASCGSFFNFLISRYLFKKWIQHRISQFVWLKNFENILENQAFKLIILLRLTPFPFGWLICWFATMEVKGYVFFVANSIGIVPDLTVLCYIGTTVKNLSELLSQSQTASIGQILLLVGEILAAIVAVGFIIWAGKKSYLRIRQLQQQKKEELMLKAQQEALGKEPEILTSNIEP